MGYQVDFTDSNDALRKQQAAAGTTAPRTAGVAAAAQPRTYANSASFPDPVDDNGDGPVSSFLPNRPAPAGTVFQSPWVANPSNEVIPPAKATPSATVQRASISSEDNARENSAMAAKANPQAGGYGVIAQAAAKAQPPYQTLPDTPSAPAGALTTEQANDYYGAQNRIMAAATNQQRQAGLAQQEARAADEARRPDSRDIQRLESEARVAKFHAANPLISGDQSGPAFEAAAAGIAANARDAEDKLKTATAAKGAPAAPGAAPLNLVQQAQEANEAANRRQKTGTEAKLTEAEVGLAGGRGKLQEQAVRQGEINEQVQRHLGALQQEALKAGPTGDSAREALAIYQKAQTGKGGPLTEEDKLKVYGDMVSRATAMGGPDAYKTLPNYSEFSASLNPKAGPQYKEGQVYQDAKGNKAVYKNGNWVAQ